MTYRIEVAEFETREWSSVGWVDQTLEEIKIYVCIVKRLYPGCHVRALEVATGELVVEV